MGCEPTILTVFGPEKHEMGDDSEEYDTWLKYQRGGKRGDE
jgi:hypothetical protein